MKTWKEKAMIWLGMLIVVGFFGVLYLVFAIGLPPENKDLGLIVVGIIGAKFGDVVAYFYGSSKGSADKTEIIKNGH